MLSPFVSSPAYDFEQDATDPARVAPDLSAFDDEDDDEPTRGGGAVIRKIHLEPGLEASPPERDRESGRALALRSGGRTNEGTKRPKNEDAMLLLEKSSLYVVADGMGGHNGGAIASHLAVEAIAMTYLEKSGTSEGYGNVPQCAIELMQSLAAANEVIRSAAARDTWLSEMGTTVVASLFCPEQRRAYIAHVGDSRCYRLRHGQMKQITSDHTLAEYGIKGKEAQRLSRAVGSNGVLEVDLNVLELQEGDVFLLCSDGITKTLSDTVIGEILEREKDPEDAASELISRANAMRARDNITAVVVRVEQAAAPSKPAPASITSIAAIASVASIAIASAPTTTSAIPTPVPPSGVRRVPFEALTAASVGPRRARR